MVRADQDLHQEIRHFQTIIPSEQVTLKTQKNLYIVLILSLNNVEVFLSFSGSCEMRYNHLKL